MTHLEVPMKSVLRGLSLLIAVASAASCGSDSGNDPTVIDFDMEQADRTARQDAGAEDLEPVDTPPDHPEPDFGRFFDIPVDDGVDSCGLPPYPFGCACEANEDCLSGYCVEGPQGFVCTQTCLEDCPEGWFCKGVSGLGRDLVFVCMPKTKKLCYPCESDSQCTGGRCVALDDGSFCTYECGDKDPCPSTFSCLTLMTDDVDVDVCIPNSGSCECISGAEGQLRPCSIENDHGICFGYETCDPEVGWMDCSAKVAEPEVCDGQDNDCDGAIDDDVPESQPCEHTNDHGTCTGDATCMGPLGWVCQAAQPSAEVCDYNDNDCDGTADEDFMDGGKYVDMEHCGSCNNACLDAFANATGTCDAAYASPKCVVDECEEGYFAVSPFQCVIPEDTDCLPCSSDEDCMGGWCIEMDGNMRCANPCIQEADCLNSTSCVSTDDLGPVCLPLSGSCECNAQAAGTKRSCLVENLVGTCYGFETCDPLAGWSECDAIPAAPEVCDGEDNDCDGVIDDDIAPTEPCEIANDFGVCAGLAACMGGAGWVCQAQEPAAEICDYQDNDCDDAIDEVFKYAGKYVTDAHCGACNNSCELGLPHATAVCEDALDPPACVVDSCEDGYFQINEFQCILPPDTQCQSCEDDGDCYFAHCVDLEDRSFCLDACGEDPCGPDEECTELAPWGPVCVPLTGACSCGPETDEAKQPCSVQNGYGICFGFKTCDGAVGWGECDALVPDEESCDGVDNDCNGFIDDGLPPTQPCEVSNDFGTCDGLASCVGQGGWACQAVEPGPEACDGVDNDCDDATDEDFKIDGEYALDDHCGVCNNVCDDAIPNAFAVCDAGYEIPKCVVETCDDGFYQAGPFTCFPVEETMCGPCVADADCPTPGDLCLELDGGSFCGRDCSAGNLYGTPAGECPEGFSCMDLGAGVEQCQPVSASCTCLEINDGDTRTCFDQNDAGICYGQQTCYSDSGWSECSAKEPAEEICNNEDDDCNLAVDDVPGRGEVCENETTAGTCPGIMDCVEGDEDLVCAGQIPSEEACNGLDDDCDDAVDETFGDLFEPCSDGVGACERFGFIKCTDDETGTWCTAEAADPADETCNGVDDDCDEAVDEDFANKGDVCTVGVGLCQNAGVMLCTPDGAGTACSVEPGDAVDELCNGLDDDCDDTVDEDFADKGDVCIVGAGLCQNAGVMLCTLDGAGTACSVEPGDPVDELCNGLDDDCDGPVDEDFVNKGDVCIVGLGICEASGTMICDESGAGTVCSAVPGDDDVEVCNGLDDDCDGPVDEGPLWSDKGDACVVSQGICAAVGVVVCDPTNPALPTICDAEAGDPEDEVCNGLDDDCNGTPDDDIAAAQPCVEQDGVCAGSVKTCGGASGWISCTSGNYGPDYETVEFSCDGKDNDCDSFTDNELPELPCAKTTGVCAGSVKPCAGVDGWSACGPAEYGPDYQADETACDLLDNDCNGTTDEGWAVGGEYILDEACGNCFTDCTVLYALPQATGYCDSDGQDPACAFLCDTGWYDLNQVPDDGCEFQHDPDAIYVSKDGNDTSQCGDGPQGVGAHGPCETIQGGLERAYAEQVERVLVAAGSYQEEIDLFENIDLLGGYNPVNWSRNITGNLTLITSPAGAGHRKTVTATGISAATLFEGFVVHGATAYTTSRNSYAIYVTGGAGALSIKNNIIYAGDGAPGSGGSPGIEGEDGTDGTQGVDAFDTGTWNCQGIDSPGGGGGHLSCDDGDMDGGNGGNAECVPHQGQKHSGTDGADGSGPGGGAGGDGGWDGGTKYGDKEYCFLCHLPSESMGGGHGVNGTVGGNGAGGVECQPSDAVGGIVSGEWMGDTGGSGGDADSGGGGGGGGAGGGGEAMDTGCHEDLGGTGGGGGSGACGGTAGTGGYPGGGAFGIFVHGTTAKPTITGNTIHRGNGGTGGVGGPGGAGGIGGDGAEGGDEATGSDDFCTGSGGKGGQGGNGGHGGGGGGGCGGVSYGIWASSYGGGSPSWGSTNTFPGGGAGGAGGAGGSSLGNSGGDGADGSDGNLHI